MFHCKSFLLPGSILLIMALVFTLNPTRAEAAPAYSVPCPPSQSAGNIDTWVQVIQFSLNDFYYIGAVHFPKYPLATDGDFGTNTKNAVDAYQKNVMKVTNGGDVVGNRTWSSMGFCDGFSGPSYASFGGSTAAHCPGALSVGSSGTWVQALQQELNIDAEHTEIPFTYNGTDWFPLALDGSFGSNTKLAVQDLQSKSGLSQDGSVGPNTWGALGMCYV